MSIPQTESVKLPTLLDEWRLSGKPMSTRLWSLVDNYIHRLERKQFGGESQYDKHERRLELTLMFLEFVRSENRDAAYSMFVFARGFVNCIVYLKLKEWGINVDLPVSKILRSSWLSKVVRVMAVEDIRRNYATRHVDRSLVDCFSEFEFNKKRIPTPKRTHNFVQQQREFEQLLAAEATYSHRRRVHSVPQV